MQFFTRAIIFVAMIGLSVVSMWTTYASLNDSILPGPDIPIPLPHGVVWECSIFALILSVAIGMMLLALKMAIIDEQKRLNITGFLGMTIIASISIAFNMDVLYRWANQDFYLTYSYNHMRAPYDEYLADVQATLQSRKDELLRQVARQEGELEAEIEGLRRAPSGYGTRAKEEDYRLRLLEKTSAVDLETINQAITLRQRADELLLAPMPRSLEGINDLQSQLRVAVKDIGSVVDKPLPQAVEAQKPFFAVFEKLLNWNDLGPMEVLILFLAFVLDLGDIVGYSLVPNKSRKKRPYLAAMPDFGSPEVVTGPASYRPVEPTPAPELLPEEPRAAAASSDPVPAPPPGRRAMRFMRRR